jgi:hypothetical protein
MSHALVVCGFMAASHNAASTTSPYNVVHATARRCVPMLHVAEQRSHESTVHA